MKFNGLSNSEIEESRKKHGTNSLTQLPPDPLWKKILLGFTDPMIVILLIALAVQLVLVFFGKAEWYEPVGVLIAILIADGVSSFSQYKQEGKASALKAEEEAKEMTKVIRNGKLTEIHISDVVVGDIIFLQAGDKIPADGEIVEGQVSVDQAVLNGETEEAEKTVADGEEYDVKDLLNKCYVYRGTVICSGEAYMKVCTVGDETIFGQLAIEVQEDKRITPLQFKLAKLAKQISVFGYVGALLIVVAITAKRLFSGDMPGDAAEWISMIIDAFTVAITVIVCAVPEGLPMLTSVLLSMQSMKMAKDNVLVHNINGLETAGSLSLLFTDKTGTITEGKLSVAEVTDGSCRSAKTFDEIGSGLKNEIIIGLGLNNSAFASDGQIIGGNSTDRALLSYLMKNNAVDGLAKYKIIEFRAFDSEKKYSTVTVDIDGENFTYIKGAPEKIINRCTHYIDENGNKAELTEKSNITAFINNQAGRAMRMLAVARADGKEADDTLTLVCVLSIRDNVRPEAEKAIKEVQSAGVQVVMITGDRRETAVAIAKESGLISSDMDVALTSAELADLNDEEIKNLLPRLRVVARALPSDKSRLVRIAQEMDLVVGMTGDGVNDSPALKKADVGFAMGSGTEVAKAAGDITILDDNFLSIEKAILYGRTMFKSIRKFLIFQLTVNVAAVLICFLGPLIGSGQDYSVILTVIQLLMVNLAMDTLAAIAFGSEPALHDYMKEKPVSRRENIISKEMFGQFVVSALYITLMCLAILFIQPVSNLFTSPQRDLGGMDITYLKSAVFASFMMAIAFNGFNARTTRLNLLHDLSKNKNFIIVMAVILLMQFVFINFGGEFLSVKALSLQSWLIAALLAFLIIPIDLIRKLIYKLIQK